MNAEDLKALDEVMRRLAWLAVYVVRSTKHTALSEAANSAVKDYDAQFNPPEPPSKYVANRNE